MKLHEIATLQHDLALLIERAEAGDEEAQLILEGIMQQLGSFAKRLKGGTRAVALALALMISGPAAAHEMIKSEHWSGVIDQIEQMSEAEFREHNKKMVRALAERGLLAKMDSAAIEASLKQPKTQFIAGLYKRLSRAKQHEVEGHPVNIKDIPFHRRWTVEQVNATIKFEIYRQVDDPRETEKGEFLRIWQKLLYHLETEGTTQWKIGGETITVSKELTKDEVREVYKQYRRWKQQGSKTVYK